MLHALVDLVGLEDDLLRLDVADDHARGAFLNDRRVRVSKRTQLKDCLIATGFPFRPGDNFKQYLAMMADLMPRTAGLRRPGAAALDLAYVAAGYADGFFESGLSIWDVAAGSLLVTEAGGLIGNFTGEADFLEQKECLAASPRIYGQLVPLLGKYSKFASAGEKAALRQAVMDDGLGSAKGCGWAHAAIEKHRAGQPVRRAVLLDACAALKLKPSSVYAAGLH